MLTNYQFSQLANELFFLQLHFPEIIICRNALICNGGSTKSSNELAKLYLDQKPLLQKKISDLNYVIWEMQMLSEIINVYNFEKRQNKLLKKH